MCSCLPRWARPARAARPRGCRGPRRRWRRSRRSAWSGPGRRAPPMPQDAARLDPRWGPSPDPVRPGSVGSARMPSDARRHLEAREDSALVGLEDALAVRLAEPGDALDHRFQVVQPRPGDGVLGRTRARVLGPEQATVGADDAEEELQRFLVVEDGVVVEAPQALVERLQGGVGGLLAQTC